MPITDPEELERQADELLKKHQAAAAAQQGQAAGAATDQHNADQADNDPPPHQTADTEGQDDATEQRIRNAQARMTRATQEASELRRANAELEQRLNIMQQMINAMQQSQQSGSARGNTANSAPADDPDDLSALDPEFRDALEEYPHVVGPIAKTVTQLRKELLAIKAEGQRDKEESAVRARNEAIARHVSTIASVHGDYEQVIASQEYQDWVSTHPNDFIRVIHRNGTAQDMIWMLNEYKRDKGMPAVDTSRPNAGRSAPSALDRAREESTPRSARAGQASAHGQENPEMLSISKLREFTPQQLARMVNDDPAKVDELLGQIDDLVSRGLVTA